MVEDERLFIRLNLLNKRPESTDELINEGYAAEDFKLTEKAQEFMSKYKNEYKERLFAAMQDEKNDIPKAMQRAGLEYYLSFLYIGEQLFKEGRFYKNEELEYRAHLDMPGR